VTATAFGSQTTTQEWITETGTVRRDESDTIVNGAFAPPDGERVKI